MEKEKVKVTKAKKVMMAINIVVILCLIAMVVFICIYFKDAIKMLSNKKDKEILIEKISNSGIWGFLILLLIQIFQVVVAFIPGEVVEIAAGAYVWTFLWFVFVFSRANYCYNYYILFSKVVGCSFC